MFARRHMGKTEFLKQDFIPAAKKADYIVVYSNLWVPVTPEAVNQAL